ncbi:MAG TPA: threonine/serine dehydratase [Jiangellaceae bacterium]
MTRTATIPTHDDVLAARDRIAGTVRRTPILELTAGELDVPGRVLLKLELLQHTGVFKARGVLNTLQALDMPSGGVVAASGGNHGAALAWAAGRAGVPATIFVPRTSPQLKVDRIRSYGADVVVVDGYYSDANAECQRWLAERDVLEVHAYDMPTVVAGQGTVGLEIVDDVPDVSAVLMSCGGGGLYAGIALGIDAHARAVPVEPERCPTLHTALAAGEPSRTEVGGVAADSLGAGFAGQIAFAVAGRRNEAPVLVPDDAIVAARRFLWERCRVLAEPGGAAAFGALLHGAYRPEPDATTVVVVSGGNHSDIP